MALKKKNRFAGRILPKATVQNELWRKQIQNKMNARNPRAYIQLIKKKNSNNKIWSKTKGKFTNAIKLAPQWTSYSEKKQH